jgi:HK97 gp10 family phage protein
MSKTVEIRLEGFKELEKRLREFGPKVAKNGLRSANFAGAKVILEAAKKTAPVRTGLLKANLRAFRRRTPDYIAKHSIGITGVRLKYGNTSLNRRLRRVGKKYKADGPAFYAKFIEYGSSKMRARPFLRPAFQANINPAIEAIRKGLSKAIDRAAKR